MILRAVRGAVAFLTTLPVGQSESAWEAFAARPAAMVAVGYVLGALVSLPLLLPLPAPIAGFGFVLAIGVFAGINNVDGLLDVADGVATHGDPAEARAAMKDSAIGVGAVLALGILLLGLFAVGITLAGAPSRALLVVVASEVGAKLAMVGVVARGTATHEGLGSALSTSAGPWTLPLGLLLALPAAILTLPHPAAAIAVAVGAGTGLVVERWARGRLGGINGDVLGATNEVARLAALLAGVIAWTLW
jgi:adenosylcobinamide-GDP ribazoletransferase